MRPIPLIIFAKAPIPGSVKTRLTSHCNDQQAAEIAKILLATSVENAVRHWPGDVIIAAWPTSNDPFIQDLSISHRLRVVQQVDGELGAKMHQCLNLIGYPAAVVGADIPHISKLTFQTTHTLLSSGKNVIGPSRDGGYYLLGLNSELAAIFNEIDWGTNKVLQQTLDRVPVDHQVHQLEECFDIDEWTDVVEAANMLPLLHNYLSDQKLL